jgi:FkbM family methyltransferase
MFQRLQFWKKHSKFEPKVIYDIGAHEGQWTRECQATFPQAQIYQFEADLDKKSLLKSAFFEVLGEEDGKTVTYFKTRYPCSTGNSILKENTKYFEGCVEEKRSIKTLHTLVEEQKLPPPDFLKIDTQGSELAIMKGAGAQLLQNAQLILLETSLQEYNQGVPLFDKEIVPFMNQQGYRMLDIVELHYVSDILIQMDVLFCKDNDNRFFSHQF